MYNTARRTLGHSLLVLGHALIWGLVELVALNRYRRPDGEHLAPGGRPKSGPHH